MLADTATSQALQEAGDLVLKVSYKDHNFSVLISIWYKAKNLFDQASNPDTQKATQAVQALFTDKSYTKITATVNSDSIEEASSLVLKVILKDEIPLPLWSSLVEKAKKLLNETTDLRPSKNPDTQKAIKAVNALFTDTTYTKIAATATSESIQDARILARKVPTNDHNYSLLNNLLTKAATLLSQTTDLRPTSNPDTQKAIQAVNALFTDTTYTKLAATATVNIDTIDKTSNLLLKIPSWDHNFEVLFSLLLKAATLLNQTTDLRPTSNPDTQKAIKATNALFTDTTYTKLAATTTSKSIHKAFKLTQKVPSEDHNHALLLDILTKAQTLLLNS
ncbi:toxin Cry1Ac domain D-VI-related protein [Enterococcus ratti]|uniref:Pesticidal crystal protein Cry1Aa domain-containing protein n=1 Tax=Enterococcus ratti TaxID=150033 RepID=A0A1L8WHN3_9ENTE|nr:toxin Cry1Ac domain D-VI-related protein [Enterococcus ratti]OJG80531.1 hypothetical protein RV14_GL000593 [Enterococcus ratti]